MGLVPKSKNILLHLRSSFVLPYVFTFIIAYDLWMRAVVVKGHHKLPVIAIERCSRHVALNFFRHYLLVVQKQSL